MSSKKRKTLRLSGFKVVTRSPTDNQGEWSDKETGSVAEAGQVEDWRTPKIQT